MDMLAGLIGFSCFTLSLTLIGLVAYWKADRLEQWVNEKLSRSKRDRAR